MKFPQLPRYWQTSLYSICLVVLAAALADLAWLHSLAWVESRFSDALIRVRATAIPADRDIVIVDIDDHSLAEMADERVGVGRFPWPRVVYGEMIHALRNQGAKAIVLDIELYEPDLMKPDNDRVLNEALATSTNTFFPLRRLDRVSADEGLRLAGDDAKRLALRTHGTPEPNAKVPLELPFVIDPQHWARTGIINFLPDDDDVGRRYWLEQDVGGWLIPSLPGRAARVLGWTVPPGESFRMSWLAGGRYPHARVSFFDIYEDVNRMTKKRPPDEFRDKVVVIGSTATHLGDFRATPIDSLTPGVEILATAIDNLKNGRRLQVVPAWIPYVVLLALFVGLLTALRAHWNLFRVLGVLLAATLTLAAAAYVALMESRLLPVAVPLLFAWIFYFLAALRAYLREQRAKEQREMVLGRFLDPRLVRNLVAEGVKLEDFKSESRRISVLFSDIRGFTALAETRPAEEIVNLLNRYFTMQAETVFRHGGTLDKFIGDAIMAFWGAPTDDERQAERAVACALDLAANLTRFNQDLDAGVAPLDIGIGIHTGPAVVGFVGSKRKLEYTAIGDTVNLASRIESETKTRTRILVSSTTREACASAFVFRDFGEVAVKGRQAVVRVYSPEGPAPAGNEPHTTPQ